MSSNGLLSRGSAKASRPPPVLQRIRVARRDSAAAELRRLQDRCAAAQNTQALARDALKNAHGVRDDMRSGRGPAASGSLRLAALPSCDALVLRAEAQLAQADAGAEQAQSVAQQQRETLHACERALMRSEAWEQQLRQSQQAQEHRVEQDTDDELAARFRSAAPTPEPAWV